MQPQPTDANPETAAPWHPVPAAARWEQLVLPPALIEMLRSLSEQARQLRSQPSGVEAQRPGMVVLFTGEPGTGKRTAARVMAGQMGVRVIEVNTPTVCSQGPAGLGAALWRLRREGEREGAILLFADAGPYLRDVSARRAPRTSEYDWDLLEHCSGYSGLVIVSSRLPARLDEADNARLAQHLIFPFPDEEARGRLWRTFLPARDVLNERELDFIAASFKLSGGGIEACCTEAARAATRLGRPLHRSDVVAALHAHYEVLLTSWSTEAALEQLRTSADGA